MPEILWEIGAFAKSVCLRWINVIGGAGFAAFFIFYSRSTGREPPVTSLWILGGCLVIATFQAWRDEHQKVKCKSRRAILIKVVDMVKAVTIYQGSAEVVTPRVETIGAFLALSEEFGSEMDVEWVCKHLNEVDSNDPFEVYEMFYGTGSFRNRKLKFLQDARAHGAGKTIKTDLDALAFIRTFWAKKNGLKEDEWPIFPIRIVDGWITFEDQQLPRPRRAAKEDQIYLVPPTLEVEGIRQIISTPLVLPKRQLQPGNETRAENEIAMLSVPDPSGHIPGVKKLP
jgi:hypothetical protein